MSGSTKTWLNNNPPSVEDDDLNGFKNENNNLIIGSGQTLNTSDNQQTQKAVSAYAAGGAYYIDSGAADVYVLSPVGAKVTPNAYFDGMLAQFIPTNPNTGASTVAVGTLGTKNLFFDGAALNGGEIGIDEIWARFDTSNDRFNIVTVGVAVPGDEVQGGLINLGIFNGTTTNANDSIVIKKADGTDLSSTNFGFVLIRSLASQVLTVIAVTANVTIDLTGAHWAAGGKGDLTDAILRVYTLLDDTSLKWGIAYQGGRDLILSGTTSITPTSIDQPEKVLVNTALASDAFAQEVGWVRTNFDDTGGAAEDLWTVQSGNGDLNIGSADGKWQPWNPSYDGFSADPPTTVAQWCSVGNVIFINVNTGQGTSNTNSFGMTRPIKSGSTQIIRTIGPVINNSAGVVNTGNIQLAASSTASILFRDGTITSNWAASNLKGAQGFFSYRTV